VWPNPHWMETEDEGHRRNFAGKSVVYAFFAGGFQRGKWNQKRAYKHCKPGYWFFETLPEEAATCVHMGGTMVDSQSSYYPASVGFEYKNTDIQNTGMEYLYQETTKNPDADVSVQGAAAAAAGQNILIPPENVNIANDYISRLIIS